MLILTLAVLGASMAVCLLGTHVLDSTVSQARTLQSQAVLAAEEGDADRAKALMLQLAKLWTERSDALEMLTSHDALHEVATGIVEAQICLECGDHDDFLRTVSVMGESLAHICDVEAFRLSNLY